MKIADQSLFARERKFPSRLVAQRSAFTLIELLVVVAIITVILSILIPSLSKAKDRARYAKCGANLRSFGAIMQLYIQEYNGFTPGKNAFQTYMASGSDGSVGAFPAYAKASMCAGTVGGYGDGFSYKDIRGAFYGFYYPNFNVARTKTSQDIVFAGDTVYLWVTQAPMYLDDQGPVIGTSNEPSTLATVAWNTMSNQPRFHARHGNAANIVWFDGHVSAEGLYRPSSVKRSVDPYGMISAYKIGLLTPLSNSVPFSTYQSMSQSEQGKNKLDYYFNPNME